MKRLLFFYIMVGEFFCTYSQPVSVETIVSFYRHTDIECYKEKIQEGMDRFNAWLVDTFPQKNELSSPYNPSEIDIRNHKVIPIVSLKYYNMGNFDMNDNIYDHLIIDSTKCIIMIPIDKKGKPMGITDIIGETYSYLSFTNKEDMKLYQNWDKRINKFLKTCHKVKYDALVYIDDLGGFGYIMGGKVFLVRYNSRKVIELSQFIRSCCSYPVTFDLLRKTDYVYWSERYDEFFEKNGLSKHAYRYTGNTPTNLIRICK